MRRGPCDLQIEAAGIGVAVDKLSCKIQAVHKLRGHRPRIDLLCADTAARDNGLLHRPRAGDGDHKALRLLEQGAPLLPGQGIGAQRRVDAGTPQQHGDHGVREEVCQRIFHTAVGIGLEIAQEARIKLSLVQRRLQIEHEGIGLPRLQMRRGRQDRRAGDAEMREQLRQVQANNNSQTI